MPDATQTAIDAIQALEVLLMAQASRLSPALQRRLANVIVSLLTSTRTYLQLNQVKFNCTYNILLLFLLVTEKTPMNPCSLIQLMNPIAYDYGKNICNYPSKWLVGFHVTASYVVVINYSSLHKVPLNVLFYSLTFVPP